MNERVIATPAGLLLLAESAGALRRIARVYQANDRMPDASEGNALLDEAQRQIEAYFAHKLRVFDLPLDMGTGSSFDRAVWRSLCDIPCGELRSYGELARRLGRPKASRAVGGACSRNPLLIVVPCHRVVAGDGRLTGFAAGMDAKRALLTHEGWHVQDGRVARWACPYADRKYR